MALNDKDKIKDLFGSKLKDFDAGIPDSVWAGIEQALPKQSPLVVNKPTRVVLRRILSVAAGLVGLLIISGVLLFISAPDKTGNKMNLAFDNRLQKNKQYLGYVPTFDNLCQSSPSQGMSGLSYSVNNESLPTEIAINLSGPVLLNINSPDILFCNTAYNKKTIAINLKPDSPQKTFRASNLPSASPVVLPSQSRSKINDNIALGLRSGGGLLSANNDRQEGIMSFTAKSHPEMSGEPSFRNQIIDLEHNQPVSFGITVSKQITSRLSFETGITYTYLSSKFKTINGDAIDEKISFHYMGVPLYANYTVASLGKADFYVSGGARIEKDIQGRYNGTLKNNEKLYVPGIGDVISSKSLSSPSDNITYQSSRVKKNIHQDNIQLSAHLSVGATFPIYHSLYVYGNIGGAYYFDADNEYPTIYSDKKTQLDLNLGLKLKF